MATLECLEGPHGCTGPVEMRWPGYGERSWPRCERHAEGRIAREQQTRERYGSPDSACAPAGFDPADAGERWDEDY